MNENSDISPELKAQRFLTPMLAAACAFLEAKWREQAWGHFNSGLSDLSQARIALSALQATYLEGSDGWSSLQLHMAAIELKAKSSFSDHYQSLDLSSLSDLLEVLLLAQEPDRDVISVIVERLVSLVKMELDRPQSIRVREFCGALLALTKSGFELKGVPQNAIAVLRSMEMKEGGWPGGANGEPSLIPTASVVELLRLADNVGSADWIRRGESFLEERVVALGWQKLGSSETVFPLATVLRVLAGVITQDRLADGLSALRSAANQDGWGAAPNCVSTIEMTSVALLALAACDESKFVPYRVASAYCSEIENKNRQLSAELNVIRENIDRQIVKDSGAILADRDKWRNEARQQSRKILDLEDELRQAQREAYDQYRRSREMLGELSRNSSNAQIEGRAGIGRQIFISTFIFAGAIVLLGGNLFLSGSQSAFHVFGFDFSFQMIGLLLVVLGLSFFWQELNFTKRVSITFVWAAIIVTFGILQFALGDAERVRIFGISFSTKIVGLLAAELSIFPILFEYLRGKRLRRFLEFKYAGPAFEESQGGKISGAVRRYSDIEAEMPLPTHEEFYFALQARIVDMPRDVGLRYANELVDRLKMPNRLKQQALTWVVDFLEFEPHSRRAIIEQIRRLNLPG